MKPLHFLMKNILINPLPTRQPQPGAAFSRRSRQIKDLARGPCMRVSHDGVLAPPNGILGKGTWENPPNFCLGKSCGVGETV